MQSINNGIYPTMITPYKNNEIDYDKVKELVEWYIKSGCTGIFAVCQSGEMQFLSLDERVRLAKATVEFAAGRVSVVASGHCGNSLNEQAEEINRMSETGVDAIVLITNRLDIHNDGDDVWISNAKKLLSMINPDITLGLYECPKPYKRLLTPKIFDWCLKVKRFAFIKDTCCDTDMLDKRLKLLQGTELKLFNANAQTFLHTLKHGAAGYSGIMANFHPDLLVWLFENHNSQNADILSNILSMTAFTENPAYPCTAKYYLGFEGIEIDTFSRSSNPSLLTSYQKLIMKQLYELNTKIRGDLSL